MKKITAITAILLIFSLIMLLILLSACSQSPNSTAKEADQQVLKLGMLRIEDNLPFFVAEQDDLYKKYVARVTLVPFSSARERDIALEAGEIQGELADLLAAALLKKGGTPVKIGSLGLGATPQEGRFAILSAPNSGLTSPQQLKGVPIAVSQNTIIHYLAEEMLKEMNLSPADIKLQNIPDLKIRLDALLAGKEVRAALLPDPLATLAEKSGAHVIVDDTKLSSNLSQTVILFREETLKNRPQEVKGILQAYQEAASRLNQDPAKYKQLILDKANIPKPLENSYRIPRFSPLEMPTRTMVERVMNWMAARQLLVKPYLYEEIVEPGFLGG